MKKVILLIFFAASTAHGTVFYVSPQGNDNNAGTEVTTPLKTIQNALQNANPGDEVRLAPGNYYQDVRTVRDGTQAAPIRVTGHPLAIIRGAGTSSRVFQINHSYHHLIGFTIDGLHGDPALASGYRDKLLYIQGTQPYSGPRGLLIDRMHFRNGGGECVRMRYYVNNSEIRYSTFNQCGIHDFQFNAGGKNGEGIYLGTSSNQWGDGKNPTGDADRSSGNHIHHNYFNTAGNECVDIKEGAENNTVEHNVCTGQLDPNSAGFDARGDLNIFRYNRSFGNEGAGIRLGGHLVNQHQFGVNNDVYGNILHHNRAGAIKFQQHPQGAVCENTMFDNPGGSETGTYRGLYAAAAPCTATPAPSPSPTALSVASVTASSDDGNVPANTLDGSLTTRWSADGNGQWIQYTLAQPAKLSHMDIAWYKGDQRVASFHLQISNDAVNWETVLQTQSSGTSAAFESYSLSDRDARYVRLVGYGNSQNTWNSVTEVVIFGANL